MKVESRIHGNVNVWFGGGDTHVPLWYDGPYPTRRRRTNNGSGSPWMRLLAKSSRFTCEIGVTRVGRSSGTIFRWVYRAQATFHTDQYAVYQGVIPAGAALEPSPRTPGKPITSSVSITPYGSDVSRLVRETLSFSKTLSKPYRRYQVFHLSLQSHQKSSITCVALPTVFHRKSEMVALMSTVGTGQGVWTVSELAWVEGYG